MNGKQLTKQEMRDRRIDKGNKIKNNHNTSLRPKCIEEDQDITLSSRGFFTPCCWLDDELYWNQPWVDKFYEEHLNITENKDIKDIFLSREWLDFYTMLKNNPQDAPPVCYEYCGGAIETDKITNIENYDNMQIITRVKH